MPSDNPTVGVSYKNGGIYFNVNDISIGSHLDQYGEVVHVVAVYGVNAISLYLNGVLKSIKSLVDFKFINDSLDYFLIGPTQLYVDSMLINNAAIYKYALSAEQIKNHYDANKTIPAYFAIFAYGNINDRNPGSLTEPITSETIPKKTMACTTNCSNASGRKCNIHIIVLTPIHCYYSFQF